MSNQQATILAVDDTPQNLDIIKSLLGERYRILGAINGSLALKIAQTQQPDLILLDIMMPEIDGYEVCRQLKQNQLTCDIPVIFLTAKTETEDEQMGLALGAVDFITKPISPPILLARIETHLRLREYSHSLEQKVAKRTEQLEQIQDASILGMGALAEYRDPETGNHIRRTQSYVKLLAESLQQHAHSHSICTPEYIDLLQKSATLHDIGKVAIPDQILHKPGKLTNEEFEIMKGHCAAGAAVIEQAEVVVTQKLQFFTLAKEIIYSHHEKWDGSGYPQGLSGEAIPLSARLMAIADVYDALISKRVYKEAFSHQKSVSLIEEGRGNHFDPEVVDSFLTISDQFAEIAERYQDTED